MSEILNDFIMSGRDIFNDTISLLEFLKDEIDHLSFTIDIFECMNEEEVLTSVRNTPFKNESLRLLIDKHIKLLNEVRDNGNK